MPNQNDVYGLDARFDTVIYDDSSDPDYEYFGRAPRKEVLAVGVVNAEASPIWYIRRNRKSGPNVDESAGVAYNAIWDDRMTLVYPSQGDKPFNLVAPVISGVGYVGSVMSVTDGTWNGSYTYTYQWYVDGLPVLGATNNTYMITIADEGAPITCTVTADALTDAVSNVIHRIIPSDITALDVWYDSADASTIGESGGLVEAWTDKSGGFYHLLQTSAALRPVTGIRTIGGVNALYFNGSKYLQNIFRPDTSEPFVRMAVFDPDSLVNVHIFNSYSGNRKVLYIDAAQRYSIFNGVVLQSTSATTNPTQMAGIFNSTTSSIRVNGDLKATGNTGIANTATGVSVGSTNAGNNRFSGAIAEVLQFPFSTLGDIETFEGYFAWRYGLQGDLPITHAYKNNPPSVI